MSCILHTFNYKTKERTSTSTVPVPVPVPGTCTYIHVHTRCTGLLVRDEYIIYYIFLSTVTGSTNMY